MTTQLKTLPVVNGGVGAGVATVDLEAKKNIIVSGLVGTVTVEGKIGSGDWCPVCTFSQAVLDKQVTDLYSEMRVNATTGEAASVTVVAERTLTRQVDVPVPPSNGPGASVDTTDLGCLTTLQLSGKNGNGSVNVESSGDGVSWGVIASFQANGCKTVRVSSKFLRAVGVNATGTVTAIAEEDAASALSAPAPTFVFRPNMAEEASGNVYKDFRLLEQAAKSVEGEKIIFFEDDGGFIVIPGETYDMSNCVWRFCLSQATDYNTLLPKVVLLLDGCKLNRLRRLESLGGANAVVSTSSTSVIDDFQTDIATQTFDPFFLNGNAVFLASSTPAAAAPMIRIPAGKRAAINTEGSISGFSGNVISVPTIEVEAGAELILFNEDGGVLGENQITGGGDVKLNTFHPPSWGPNYYNGALPAQYSCDHAGHTGAWITYASSTPPCFAPTADLAAAVPYGSVAKVDTMGGGPYEVLLPKAARRPGVTLVVKDIGGNAAVNNITITPFAGDTIDGAVSQTISANWGKMTLVSDDGTSWYIIGD